AFDDHQRAGKAGLRIDPGHGRPASGAADSPPGQRTLQTRAAATAPLRPDLDTLSRLISVVARKSEPVLRSSGPGLTTTAEGSRVPLRWTKQFRSAVRGRWSGICAAANRGRSGRE